MQLPPLTFLQGLLSVAAAAYVWFLPLLAEAGFAERGAESVSAFIANPPSTGAMAALSFTPLVLMWEYNDVTVPKLHANLLRSSLWTFQLCYAAFLVCTVGYAPMALHTAVVTMFGLAFLVHALLVITYVQPNLLSRLVLGIGVMAFASLLWVKGMYFWVAECVGLTSMFLFTPIDWIIIDIKRSASDL